MNSSFFLFVIPQYGKLDFFLLSTSTVVQYDILKLDAEYIKSF